MASMPSDPDAKPQIKRHEQDSLSLHRAESEGADVPIEPTQQGKQIRICSQNVESTWIAALALLLLVSLVIHLLPSTSFSTGVDLR